MTRGIPVRLALTAAFIGLSERGFATSDPELIATIPAILDEETERSADAEGR